MSNIIFHLSKNCAQIVEVLWDKSVVKHTQVLRRYSDFVLNTSSIHSYSPSAGKLRLVLSPVYPQSNFHISQMEPVVYAQYPQSLLLRLLFNIIRERP